MLLDAVEWLGHSGFRLRGPGSTIYIAPSRLPEGQPAERDGEIHQEGWCECELVTEPMPSLYRVGPPGGRPGHPFEDIGHRSRPPDRTRRCAVPGPGGREHRLGRVRQRAQDRG